MENRSGTPWKQILIVIAAAFVLAASACFGMSFSNSDTLSKILAVPAIAGAATFVIGLVVLVIALVAELIGTIWRRIS
jgi:hypothetical protein